MAERRYPACNCGHNKSQHAPKFCRVFHCPCTGYAAAPTPVEPWKCGKPATAFIPRWGMYFACVLGKGHEGECMPGGTCSAHGDYVGDQCSKWPDCIKDLLAAPAESQGVTRPVYARECRCGEYGGSDCHCLPVPVAESQGVERAQPVEPKTVCPCKVGSDGYVYRHHTPDCPAAQPGQPTCGVLRSELRCEKPEGHRGAHEASEVGWLDWQNAAAPVDGPRETEVEAFARRLWCRWVGIPITEPYTKEFNLLVEELTKFRSRT